MSTDGSNNVKETLQQPLVHEQWTNYYRTEENDLFFDEVFDYLACVIKAEKSATILDAGCGSGKQTVRLAKRGFFVEAVDFSDYILKTAEQYIRINAVIDSVSLHREDLLSLSFPDETFDYILCWGVLMHIPDVEKAMSELDRVLKKGGILVISEANMNSIQSLLFRNLKLLLGKKNEELVSKETGIEHWATTSSGTLMTREANIEYFKNWYKNRGFIIERHFSGQFTELYTKFHSRFLRGLVHRFNLIWFRYVKSPYFSFGNILVLKKR